MKSHLVSPREKAPYVPYDVDKDVVAPRTLIIAGPQGVGKDTQAARLQDRFGYNPFGMSDGLKKKRDLVVDFKGTQMTVGEIMDSGENAPDDVCDTIVDEYVMTRSQLEAALFNGFPRNDGQNRSLVKKLTKANRFEDTRMLLLEATDEQVKDNIALRVLKDPKNAREDDKKPESVQKRLTNYRKLTEPIADFYEKEGKLIRINGITDFDVRRAIAVLTRIRELEAIDADKRNGGRQELDDLSSEYAGLTEDSNASIDIVYQRILDAFRKQA